MLLLIITITIMPTTIIFIILLNLKYVLGYENIEWKNQSQQVIIIKIMRTWLAIIKEHNISG